MPDLKPVEPSDIVPTDPLHRVGDLFIAGQPKPADLTKLAREEGLRTIVNLRKDAETNEFDEADLASSLGLDYVHVPWDGVDELTDDIFDRIRTLLTSSDRPLLLHCAGANRAAAVWLPYRALDEGRPWDDAVDDAKTAGLTSSDYVERARRYVESHTT